MRASTFSSTLKGDPPPPPPLSLSLSLSFSLSLSLSLSLSCPVLSSIFQVSSSCQFLLEDDFFVTELHGCIDSLDSIQYENAILSSCLIWLVIDLRFPYFYEMTLLVYCHLHAVSLANLEWRSPVHILNHCRQAVQEFEVSPVVWTVCCHSRFAFATCLDSLLGPQLMTLRRSHDDPRGGGGASGQPDSGKTKTGGGSGISGWGIFGIVISVAAVGAAGTDYT